MGISSQPSFVSLFTSKDLLLQGSEENSNSLLWSKVMAAKKVTKKRVMIKSRRRPARRILMKRRGGYNGIQRRVGTLKSLVPNSDQSMGLDGLFRETANYILSLQTRVRVMQVMVEVLTAGSDDE